MIKFILLLLLSLILFILTMFFYLGEFLDVTEEATPSDVIVLLGGGDTHRMTKALALYKEGYSLSGKILLTGSKQTSVKLSNGNRCKSKIDYLKHHTLKEEDIVYLPNTYNTFKELLSIKQYLHTHNIHSVLIVTDPPHSRRISFLADAVAKFKADNIHFKIISSDVTWWNSSHYRDSKRSTNFALLESVKLVYNYAKYGLFHTVFSSLGILTPARTFFFPLEKEWKAKLIKYLAKHNIFDTLFLSDTSVKDPCK